MVLPHTTELASRNLAQNIVLIREQHVSSIEHSATTVWIC